MFREMLGPGKPGKIIREDDWLLEEGERGHGFCIASFPTKEAAEAVRAQMAGLLGDDWAHVIAAREVIAIRRRARHDRGHAPRRDTP